MLSIGEFSHTTRLSVKTLRYYQELGILLPAETDEISGYRYYDQQNYERVQSIIMLKELGFTLKEISTILGECQNEEDLKFFIEKKLDEVERKLKNLRNMKRELQQLKSSASESGSEEFSGIMDFHFELPCYVSMELTGQYELIGKGYSRLYRKYGRFAQGKPYAFFLDMEHKEREARMEAVVQLASSAPKNLSGTKSFVKRKAVKVISTVFIVRDRLMSGFLTTAENGSMK